MENNDIMKRLLQDDGHEEQAKKSVSASKSQKDEEMHISRIRVVTAKYKVYIVLLLIFICMLLLEWIPSMKDAYNAKQSALNQVNSQLAWIRSEVRQAEDDMQYLWEITDSESTLKTCLNERNKDACLSLPENWMTWEGTGKKYDFSIPLSYLQLHSLYNKKMPIDEKKVLKNLNEYLIKQDIMWGSRTKVWDILRISIGDPHAVTNGDTHFFQAPVDVTIGFTTIGDLTGFLYNVEKKMVDKWDDRILYKIQSVSYDIISSDEPQVTDISMLAYYYHDERFENIVEEPEATQDNKNADNSEANTKQKDKSNSDWFLNKIFKSQ